MKQIAEAAVAVIAERGYYGMTIQEVADRVGLSQAGILKYVKDKNGLLTAALKFHENHSNGYITQKLAMSPAELKTSPALMPEWYRETVAFNAENPRLTQMYLVLRGEALDNGHPAHDYFADRGGRLRRVVGQVHWKLPPEYQTPKDFALLSMTVGSALDGLEYRWLGEDSIDLQETWAIYENILFPLPHWEGFR